MLDSPSPVASPNENIEKSNEELSVTSSEFQIHQEKNKITTILNKT